MATTPVQALYRHYVYESSTKTIWYTDEKLPESEEFEYLGKSNNPIPASAATALTQQRSDIKGCKVKRKPL